MNGNTSSLAFSIPVLVLINLISRQTHSSQNKGLSGGAWHELLHEIVVSKALGLYTPIGLGRCLHVGK